MYVEEPSDAELWLQALSGTESAFTVIFDRYRERIFRKAYARVRHLADAEDIVAVVFLEAWRLRKRVRIVDGSLLPWLLSVTTNVTLNSERTKRRYGRLLAKLPPALSAPDPSVEVDERLDSRTRSIKLTEALRRLSPVEQTVVDLCLVEELPLATVASVLDLPVGTIKSRLHRARLKLRTDLIDPDIPLGDEKSSLPERGPKWV